MRLTAMRARGAKVTDIVFSWLPPMTGSCRKPLRRQSCQAAEAPIAVAINKMDKAEADPTRVKNELLQHEIIAEDMGGDTQMIGVGANRRRP